MNLTKLILYGPKKNINLFFHIIFFIHIGFESSFTGTAGTAYRYKMANGSKIKINAQHLFVYFAILIFIEVLRNINYFIQSNKKDFVSVFLYTLSIFIIYYYGHMTHVDFLELNQNSTSWWWQLGNISTMGNQPLNTVESKAIHWAICEAVVIILVIIDVVYICIREERF